MHGAVSWVKTFSASSMYTVVISELGTALKEVGGICGEWDMGEREVRGRGRGIGGTCLVLWMFWLWKCYDHLACEFCEN